MRLRYSRPVTSLDTAETACYSPGIRNIEAYFETDFVPAFAISWALPTQEAWDLPPGPLGPVLQYSVELNMRMSPAKKSVREPIVSANLMSVCRRSS